MRLPISWLKDFVDLKGLAVEQIARTLTLAGLEVGEITYVGLPPPVRKADEPNEFKTSGIGWDRAKIVVAEIREVKPHPNADRLTLLDLFDGKRAHTVLTGAPNIFHLKGQGKLPHPLKVAWAQEGASLYDGHAEGLQLTTLKRTTIRGVESYSMVCSEKELGIAEDHEGIIILDSEAPVGMPLADYMGDAVLDIDIVPNMARNANVMGVARELAALTGRKFEAKAARLRTTGPSIKPLVAIRITDPKLNPRFVLGLIRDVHIGPSPYEVQRRLKLAGMRPINNVVDATNYAMLETGQPLHAFDFDALKRRAGKGGIKISTRTAQRGETLVTLDGVKRNLTPLNVLVCDESGPLSIAGVMGGAETEVGPDTTNVLLEGAAWNFINIRRTAREHSLPSEASFRFSRGVHPALAQAGVERGLQCMSAWTNGRVAPGLVDQYPLKARPVSVSFKAADVKRLLGIDLKPQEIVRLLEALDFSCRLQAAPPARGKSAARDSARDERITVSAPLHRMDIGTGVVGVADVMEEIARLVGYDRIPTTNMADALPAQVGNPAYEWDEHLRDVLVAIGFQEVVSYRLTSAARESRLDVADEHVHISNPIAPERSVLRRSLLASVLDNLERNMRWTDSLAFFEIGPIFEPIQAGLPAERQRLALAMTGPRQPAAWDGAERQSYDFYDLKGRMELLLSGLRLHSASYKLTESVPYLHPGKGAGISVEGQAVGALGELSPIIHERYSLGQHAVIVAELDLDVLRALPAEHRIRSIADYPPILEDIAVILDDAVPAARVEELIRDAGGDALVDVRLFDLYRGEQIGPGRKSLAYSLTYQAADRTLTDSEAAAIRNRVVKRLERDLGAVLRS